MNNIWRANREAPFIIALGSGKGGVGRSTLAAEVGRSLIAHDERVLCVDADPTCSTLGLLFQRSRPEYPDFDSAQTTPLGNPGAHVADFIQDLDESHLWFLSLATSRRSNFGPHHFSPDQIISQLSELAFDWIIIDLPSGYDDFQVGLFALADLPVNVCAPAPVAAVKATVFLRKALMFAVDWSLGETASVASVAKRLERPERDLSVQSLLEATESRGLQEQIEQACDQFESYVALNLVREGAERDLGYAISHAWHEEIGHFPRPLVSIDYTDRRWFYNRRMTKGTSTGGADHSLSQDVEELTKTLRNIENFDREHPRPVKPKENSAARRIGVNPRMEQRLIRQRCRRLWEAYRRENITQLIFTDPEHRDRIADELQALYRELLGAQTSEQPTVETGGSASGSQATDSSASKTESAGEVTGPDEVPRASRTSRKASSTETDTERSPPSGVPRAVERIVERRKQLNLNRQDLSSQTQIGMKYLSAIERADTDHLPRDVYLKGYLRQIGQALDLEPQELIQNYLAFLNDNQNPSTEAS